MNPKRIVAATDFSEVSLTAVERAFDLASVSGARVDIVFVREPSIAATSLDFPLVNQEYESTGKDRLDRFIPEGMRSRTATIILEGNPAHEIASFASMVRADVIVVGTHGRRGLSRLLLGSTAEALIRQAPCDVLVARQRTLAEIKSPEPELAACCSRSLKGGDELC